MLPETARSTATAYSTDAGEDRQPLSPSASKAVESLDEPGHFLTISHINIYTDIYGKVMFTRTNGATGSLSRTGAGCSFQIEPVAYSITDIDHTFSTALLSEHNEGDDRSLWSDKEREDAKFLDKVGYDNINRCLQVIHQSGTDGSGQKIVTLIRWEDAATNILFVGIDQLNRGQHVDDLKDKFRRSAYLPTENRKFTWYASPECDIKFHDHKEVEYQIHMGLQDVTPKVWNDYLSSLKGDYTSLAPIEFNPGRPLMGTEVDIEYRMPSN